MSGLLVRCFRPVVSVSVLAVHNRGHHFFPCRTIAFEFIGNHPSRRLALVLQHFAEKPLGSVFITPIMNKNIVHVIILIDSAPEIVAYAFDLDDNSSTNYVHPIALVFCEAYQRNPDQILDTFVGSPHTKQ